MGFGRSIVTDGDVRLADLIWFGLELIICEAWDWGMVKCWRRLWNLSRESARGFVTRMRAMLSWRRGRMSGFGCRWRIGDRVEKEVR